MTKRWPTSIGILGAGALGSLFGYYLTRHTSAEVWLFSRRPLPGEVEVQGDGWTAVRVATRPSKPVDLLIVLVKSYGTQDAIRRFEKAVGPETVVLTLQNGWGNAEILAQEVGEDRVLAGTTSMGATLMRPGRVKLGGIGPTYIGPWVEGGLAAERAMDVAQVLFQASFPTEVVADPRQQIWSKLVVNCAINPLTAILRVPNGQLLSRPRAQRLLEAVAQETAAVAAAAGIPLEEDPVSRVVEVAKATSSNRSSMLQDVERGRRTEIEAINGAVVELGEKLGVPTPVNAVLTDLILSMPTGQAGR